MTDNYISRDQYVGSSADGVYSHCSVDKRLDDHYNSEGRHTWDKSHLANTVDTEMRNPKKDFNKKEKKFTWLNDITLAICKANKFVNWGREHQHFYEVCQAMWDEGYPTKYKSPKFPSETKFAAWIRHLYKDLHDVYPGLLRTFEETKWSRLDGGEREREQARSADEVHSCKLDSR